ncbi:uncharacterized protein [Nicotiana sylvestris]|uniref:uncharacterized protein n=1 Tax=Nicotiana sylvestris TaxID=4096 RepID=UPI00388C5E97
MSNQVTIGALFQEGTSQVRSPYFNGQHFPHWKVRMKIYVKSYDVKLWLVIKKGNYLLPTSGQPPTNPEDIDDYLNEQMAIIQVDSKARNLLDNAICGEEYENFFSCDTAKEVWEKLEVTYEGTNKLKEIQIILLVHDYELFQMKEGESIKQIFAQFSKIIGDLKVFGRPYSNKLSSDELREDFIAFEKTHLKKTCQEEKKKTFSFKTTIEGFENDIDDDAEALEEEIAMVSRNMNGLMRRYKTQKREGCHPEEPDNAMNKNKNDTKYFECGRYGQLNVSDLKIKILEGFSKNKFSEARAMKIAQNMKKQQTYAS